MRRSVSDIVKSEQVRRNYSWAHRLLRRRIGLPYRTQDRYFYKVPIPVDNVNDSGIIKLHAIILPSPLLDSLCVAVRLEWIWAYLKSYICICMSNFHELSRLILPSLCHPKLRDFLIIPMLQNSTNRFSSIETTILPPPATCNPLSYLFFNWEWPIKHKMGNTDSEYEMKDDNEKKTRRNLN